MKRLTSLMLALTMLLSLCCPTAQAASTPEEALGTVHIYSGGYQMSYLAVNGKVQKQEYTYFQYRDKNTGEEKEIPAYCVNPNLYGVPQTVGKGESIEYLAEGGRHHCQLLSSPGAGRTGAGQHPPSLLCW